MPVSAGVKPPPARDLQCFWRRHHHCASRRGNRTCWPPAGYLVTRKSIVAASSSVLSFGHGHVVEYPACEVAIDFAGSGPLHPVSRPFVIAAWPSSPSARHDSWATPRRINSPCVALLAMHPLAFYLFPVSFVAMIAALLLQLLLGASAQGSPFNNPPGVDIWCGKAYKEGVCSLDLFSCLSDFD